MTAIKAYIEGWKATFKTRSMWLLLYGVTFVLALLAALPLKGFMAKTVGQSLALNKSLPGFNYTFIGDVMNEYGDSIGLILNQSLVVVLLFLLISIFFVGGILSVFKQPVVEYDSTLFWQGCSRYFWRLLRLSVYFILLHGALIALLGMLFLSLTNYMSPFETESDLQWVQMIQIIGPIYILLATFLFMVHDYAKLHVVHSNRSLITKPVIETFRFVFKNLGKFFLLYLFNILTFLVIFGIYYFLKNLLLADTFGAITLLFLLTQIFIMARVGLKLLNLGSAAFLYKALKL